MIYNIKVQDQKYGEIVEYNCPHYLQVQMKDGQMSPRMYDRHSAFVWAQLRLEADNITGCDAVTFETVTR